MQKRFIMGKGFTCDEINRECPQLSKDIFKTACYIILIGEIQPRTFLQFPLKKLIPILELKFIYYSNPGAWNVKFFLIDENYRQLLGRESSLNFTSNITRTDWVLFPLVSPENLRFSDDSRGNRSQIIRLKSLDLEVEFDD